MRLGIVNINKEDISKGKLPYALPIHKRKKQNKKT